MTDVTEAWSGPWHALQRTLAAGITGYSAATGSGDYRTALEPSRAAATALPSGSWLRRAHARVRGDTHAGAANPVGAK